MTTFAPFFCLANDAELCPATTCHVWAASCSLYDYAAIWALLVRQLYLTLIQQLKLLWNRHIIEFGLLLLLLNLKISATNTLVAHVEIDITTQTTFYIAQGASYDCQTLFYPEDVFAIRSSASLCVFRLEDCKVQRNGIKPIFLFLRHQFV